MNHLIGINGFKRAGKGAVASLLSNIYDGVVYEVGFADKVKIYGALALTFDRPPRDLIALMDEIKIDGHISVHYREPGTDTPILHDLTGREYLQYVGTRAREVFGDNFWVDQVLPTPAPPAYAGYEEATVQANKAALDQRFPEIDCVAITDLRFENEAQRVLDLGGVIWRVNRPGCVSDGHASEQPLPDDLVTLEIDNSGDLAALEREVERALSTL